ncbi:DUF6111 family protein [Hyphomonas sp.]|uniref:DUF6111 family protein n=1 Tax=Hyphomonas sp. TaxID=87 RepID=UPI00391DF607
MAGRLLFELFVFSLPFLVFGIYVLATRSAEEAGRRKWPIQLLFAIGIALATIAWFVLIALEPRERGMCIEPERVENGVVIPARSYECEHRPEDVGIPRRDAPQAPADDPS